VSFCFNSNYPSLPALQRPDNNNNSRGLIGNKDSVSEASSDLNSLSLQLTDGTMSTNTVRTVDEKNGVQITQTTTKTASKNI
jgi:hypothetical protein